MPHYFLDKLKIKNFRNLEDEIVPFDPGINCIFGENGNGKTNLLEAIYVITERKSFRKNTAFPQFININGEVPEILFQTNFRDIENREYAYSGKLHVQKNEYFFNGKSTRKKLHVQSVFISPFDSLLFHSTPAFRRQWFDRNLSAIDPQYKKCLRDYNQALKMRNSLLITKSTDFYGQLRAIDNEMAEYTFVLLQKRVQFIGQLKNFFTQTFHQLFSEDHKMEIKIQTKFGGLSVQEIYSAMQNQLEKDLLSGRTNYGVHRDDYMLLFDGLNAFEVCSLGQQKMAFLGLSFAYIELFKYNLGVYPIVLIDDVSGELDRKRWNNLIQYICVKEFQTFITTANEDFKMELERIEGIKKLSIHQGKVTIH